MTIERFRQFRKYQSRIHPMSKFRNFWDLLILHVIIMNKIIFRYTSTFIFNNLPMYLFYFGGILELIIIADFFVNIKTGYIDIEAKQVVLDANMCVLNFCTKKLFFHFASAIPLHWFMFLRYGADVDCGLCKTNMYVCVLKIISIFSLLRVYETSAYWTQKRRSVNKVHFFKFLRIGVIGLVTMFQFYDISELVCLLVFMHDGHVIPSSTLGFRAGMKYGKMEKLIPNYMYVCYDVSRMFKSLLLFSFGNGEKSYYLDNVTSLIAYLIANAFYALSLLECYALISRIMYPKDQIMRLKNRALNLLACRQLSEDLRSKVVQYFNFAQSKLNMVEKENGLYKSLPEVLKNEAKLNCYIKYMMRIPFFCDWPLPIVEELALMLKREVFLNNDIVADAWVPGIGLMIVENGVLAVHSEHYKELGHLIDGDYFGELSLITDKELCMSFVVAITPCTILILEKLAFRSVMRAYPKEFSILKLQLKAKYAQPVESGLQSEGRMSSY